MKKLLFIVNSSLLFVSFPQIRDNSNTYDNPLMGVGSFTAAKYGTRCPAHEYGTELNAALLYVRFPVWEAACRNSESNIIGFSATNKNTKVERQPQVY